MLLLTASGDAPTDPTAYYNDFWTYASYYGEAAARAYYQAWSPPEGTAPPPGVVVPSAQSAADGTASSSIAATGASVSSQEPTDSSVRGDGKAGSATAATSTEEVLRM